MAPRKQASSRSKVVQSKEDAAPAQPDNTSSAPAEQEDYEMHPVVYSLRQNGGFVLGLISVLGTWWFFDQDDEWAIAKLWGWLCVGLVGLVVHELRPYQRAGYGSLIWPKLLGGISDTVNEWTAASNPQSAHTD